MYSGKLNEKIKDRKLILYAAIGVVVLLVLILVSVWTSGDNSQNSNSGDAEQAGAAGSGLIFTNSKSLEDSMGSSISSIWANNIQTVVGMADEGGNGDAGLSATIDAASLVKGIYFPYATNYMLLNISDERQYVINVALDGEKYCGVLIQRTMPSVGQPYLYVTIIDGSQNQDSVIRGLMDWAKSIYPDGYIVTTENKNYL